MVVENNEQNYKICIEQGNCSKCPSFPGNEGEGLYCVRGHSKSAIDKRGCNCPECPVWINGGLSGMYYCMKPSNG